MSTSARSFTLRIATLIPAVLPVVLGGCAYGHLKQVLRSQVAAELDCPTVKVTTKLDFQQNYKANEYRAEGCGVARLYQCPPDDGMISYSDHLCTYVDANPPAPQAAAPAPSGTDDADSAPSMMDEPPADEPAAPVAPAPQTSSKGSASTKGGSAKASGSVGLKLGN